MTLELAKKIEDSFLILDDKDYRKAEKPFLLKSKNVRYQWLMCMDDYKTDVERIGSLARSHYGAIDHIEAIAGLHGYKVLEQLIRYKKGGTICITEEGPKYETTAIADVIEEQCVLITAPDGQVCQTKFTDYLHMMDDIEDYIIFRFSKFFKE